MLALSTAPMSPLRSLPPFDRESGIGLHKSAKLHDSFFEKSTKIYGLNIGKLKLSFCSVDGRSLYLSKQLAFRYVQDLDHGPCL